MDRLTRETIASDHSQYVENFHESRLKIYELTPKLSHLMRPWKELYGNNNSSFNRAQFCIKFDNV